MGDSSKILIRLAHLTSCSILHALALAAALESPQMILATSPLQLNTARNAPTAYMNQNSLKKQ